MCWVLRDTYVKKKKKLINPCLHGACTGGDSTLMHIHINGSLRLEGYEDKNNLGDKLGGKAHLSSDVWSEM